MRIIALILAVFVAFPNLGYSLTSGCCSHETVEVIDCHDEIENTEEENSNDHEPCTNQCDCSCCHNIFLISKDIESPAKAIVSIIKTIPLNKGTSFAKGFSDSIWQPPRLG